MAKDYVTELENLKTSLLGYDREAVITLIGEILAEKDAEKEAALQEMGVQIQQAAAENAALQREIETRKQVYEELVKRVDQLNHAMDSSMDRIGGYAKENAAFLQAYCRREEELQAKEAASLQEREALLGDAKEERAQLLESARAEAEGLLENARQEAEGLLERAKADAEQMISRAKAETRKQKEQYLYYREALRNYCDHIYNFLEEEDKKEEKAVNP